MTWDPLKTQNLMCNRWDCIEIERLHPIVRRCPFGHVCRLVYCDEHITGMMDMAMRRPGLMPNGIYLGKLLCRACGAILELVMEQ